MVLHICLLRATKGGNNVLRSGYLLRNNDTVRQKQKKITHHDQEEATCTCTVAPSKQWDTELLPYY
jgi:hypothetical protein